jgi:hypothetical protein
MNESYQKKHRDAKHEVVLGTIREIGVFLSCVAGSAAARFVPDLNDPVIGPINAAQIIATVITAVAGYGIDFLKASGNQKALAGRKKNWKTRVLFFFFVGYFALDALEKFTP